GVAEGDWYPAFLFNGTIGFDVKNFGKPLGSMSSATGAFGPAFQWEILNYGRILNNVRLQDFKTQELVGVYQQQVLSAAREVENGIISFLNARDEAAHLAASVVAAERAVSLANALFRAGVIDYTPVFVAEQFLAQQQNLLAQAEGDVALGLITVYRALGGGWELRLTDHGTPCGAAPAACPATTPLPAAADGSHSGTKTSSPGGEVGGRASDVP